jgi:hypothetical protein
MSAEIDDSTKALLQEAICEGIKKAVDPLIWQNLKRRDALLEVQVHIERMYAAAEPIEGEEGEIVGYRIKTGAFREQYPQTEFGQNHVVFSPASLTDHNIDGTLERLARGDFPPGVWPERELRDTETLLRELRDIPEAQRLAEL